MKEILIIISILLLLLTLPGSVYLALLSVAGLLPPKRKDKKLMYGRIGIIVPAHNEATCITRTLNNLLEIARLDGDTDVIVVADNCSDDTALIASSMGASVIERNDVNKLGKGYALDFAFNALAPKDYEAYAVIDADTIAADNFIFSLRQHFANGADAVQTRYTVLDAELSPRTQIAEIALAGFNILRPRGRNRLNISAGILGNGFALRRKVLEKVPYCASSVVEDLEYHLSLIQADIKVDFADDTEVRGEMPTGEQGMQTQRTRWEGGRLRMFLEHAPMLLKRTLCGQLRYLDPLVDLMLLPLAYHVMVLIVSLTLALITKSTIVLICILASIAVVALHVIIAIHVAKMPWSKLWVLLKIPGYLIWKLSMITRTLSGASGKSSWIRTNRDGS